MNHLQTLQKYYDVQTLRAWIAEHEHSENKRQKDQVARWRRVLQTLEKVEPPLPIPDAPQTAPQGVIFDDYTQNA